MDTRTIQFPFEDTNKMDYDIARFIVLEIERLEKQGFKILLDNTMSRNYSDQDTTIIHSFLLVR